MIKSLSRPAVKAALSLFLSLSAASASLASITYWDYSSIDPAERSASNGATITLSESSAATSLGYQEGSPYLWLFVDYSVDEGNFTYYGTIDGGSALITFLPQTIGTTISSSTPDLSNRVTLSSPNSSYNIFESTAGEGYLGFSFDYLSKTFYGWINLTVTQDGVDTTEVIVNQLAFNSTPDGSIEVGAIPEPSTMALAALAGAGAMGLARVRRNK